MRSVTAYETNAGKRYRVIYRKPDHIQTHKRGLKTKRDAELFLAKVQTDSEPKDYETRSIPVPSTILAEPKTHVEGKEAACQSSRQPEADGCADKCSVEAGSMKLPR